MPLDRRRLLLAAGASALMPTLAKALSIPADVRTGTIPEGTRLLMFVL